MIKSNDIVLVSTRDVKVNPKNRNKHSKEQIDRLVEIITYQGFRAPLLISNRTGLLVAGHGRLEAAKQLKLKEVPVMFQDFDDEAQEYAAMVSDNAIASWSELDLSGINLDIGDLGPDFNIDLLGIKNFTVDVAEKVPLCDEDEVPDQVEPKAKLGDIYKLGSHRLMCGDSTSIDAVEKLMAGEKAKMLFTDPPYGDGHAAMDIDSSMAKKGKSIVTKQYKILSDDNLDFLEPAMNCALAVLTDDATKMVFFKWKKWNEVLSATRAFGSPSACIVWDRDVIAAATMRFNPCHEFCFHWGSLTDKHSKSNLRNVWRCQKEYENKILHPTVKPIEIISPAIEVCTDLGQLVLDLFGGSGSTLIACEKTNRKCFMMELDPHYVDVIVARWEKYTGQKAELLNGEPTTD